MNKTNSAKLKSLVRQYWDDENHLRKITSHFSHRYPTDAVDQAIAEAKAEREEKDKCENYIAESNLRQSGTINLWSPARIKKYLRKYSKGPGFTRWGRAANRYDPDDVAKAKQELLKNEKKENGLFVNPSLDFLQAENCL